MKTSAVDGKHMDQIINNDTASTYKRSASLVTLFDYACLRRKNDSDT